MNTMRHGIFLTLLLSILLVVSTTSAMADGAEFKHYGVRLRALAVIPDQNVDSRIDNLEVEAKLDVTPELDLEYFFTRNFSSELILGVTKHDLVAQGRTLGSTWLLPPTLTFKYHPLPNSRVSPYIGVGINYVIPFNDKANGVIDVPDFHVKSSVGWAAQAGADLALGNNWFLNLDFKYLNVDTQVRINGTDYDLDLNPYIVGTGVGYRF
ncbi:outer membrane protein [Geotalea uraniireducens]|uniref:Outer membrane protein n=1 Tax=Geotalea uraniireducens TaxID=351604 RepID=A0ABN6VNS9_9BACT|nr:OmpW family outer membrane protein [Geotalea uraniireducens]BDV41803.1 outer membrane protein [Geotalea uraniireducens]